LVAFVSKFSIDSSTDKYPVTAFGDSNKQYVVGLPDDKGAYSGFADIAGSTLYTAARDGLARNTYFYPDFVNDVGSYWFFTAFYDWNGDWDVSNGAAVQGTWVASSLVSQVIA
jgi:hypothetical protein